MKYEIIKLRDLPDYYIEHLANLEQSIIESLMDHFEGQRKDIIICASISAIVSIIGKVFEDDIEWLNENKSIYEKSFAVYLKAAIYKKIMEKRAESVSPQGETS